MTYVGCNQEECKFNKIGICKRKDIYLESTVTGDASEFTCHEFEEKASPQERK